MPDSLHQQAPLWRRMEPKTSGFLVPGRSILALTLLIFLLLPALVLADSTVPGGYRVGKKQPDPNGYDIAIIIDNRDVADLPSAREDIQALTAMLDRHMFADYIIRLERPSLAVICDIFGGCPNEASHVWPSLIAQITDPGQSRLFVYYLGPARVEGQERQLLFGTNKPDEPQRTSAYSIGWLHKQLEKTASKSAILLMETSFAPRPLPCISENPLLIDATMKTVQRNYKELIEGRDLPRGLAEFSATLPDQSPHCDRYELTSDDTKRPLFTKFVLKGVVEGEADQEPFGDEDGWIELGELAAYTDDQIKRAVQFQWGREQNVWPIGPDSRRLARVEPRPSTPSQIKVEKTGKPTPLFGKRCEQNPKAPGCHVCDQDATGKACVDFCQRNPGSFACRQYTAFCRDKPPSDICPCDENDPRSGCTGKWCRWSATELGPGFTAVIGTVGVRPDDICRWTTRDEGNVAPGALWQLFTPIIWRLARPYLRPSIACILTCEEPPAQVTASIVEIAKKEMASIKSAAKANLDTPKIEPGRAGEEPPVPMARTAFNNEVCDETLPPYIGLPRWLLGTRLIADGLRARLGCKPPPEPKKFALPPPVWTYPPRLGMPPPVPLLNAPPVPDPHLVRCFRLDLCHLLGMPPPIALRTPRLPSFEPTVSQIRRLQSALTLGNFNPGQIDGTRGEQTDAALKRWRNARVVGNVIGELTEVEFEEIVTEFGDLFDQVQPSAPLY